MKGENEKNDDSFFLNYLDHIIKKPFEININQILKNSIEFRSKY